MNPYADVDKKILGEIYNSNEPWDNLEVLCDVYGCRWPGTDDDLNSVKYMVDKLKEYGLKDAYYEPFKMPGNVDLRVLRSQAPSRRASTSSPFPSASTARSRRSLWTWGLVPSTYTRRGRRR